MKARRKASHWLVMHVEVKALRHGGQTTRHGQVYRMFAVYGEYVLLSPSILSPGETWWSIRCG